MSETAKKETVLFPTEEIRRDGRLLREKTTAPAPAFSIRSQDFEASRQLPSGAVR